MRYLTIGIILTILISGCGSNQNTDALFSLVPSSKSGLKFSNDLPINLDLNIFNYMYYYNGGGTGVGDLNQDGWVDVVFSSNLGSEKVYLNQGELKFKDISEIAQVDGGPDSWTNGVAIVDINGDGLLDIYLSQVCTYRELNCTNKLFICTHIDENQIPHYEEQSAAYGLDFKGFSTQAGFFDFDLDGDLDMFLMNHSLHHNGTFGQRKEFAGKFDEESGDRLYRNDNGQFTDITKTSGIQSTVIGYGLGLAFGDVNNDGFPDIYIGNDFHENDYLYINQQDGTFKEMLTAQIKHTSRFSMGVDIADVNDDGFQDIISLDMLPEDPYILKTSEGEDALGIFNFKLGYGYNHQYARNALQLNQGNGQFKEVGAYAGIHATDWSWTPLFFDFDMDGYKDLFISNGIPKRMNDIDYINFITGNDIQYKIQFDHLENQDLSALEKIPEIRLYNKFYQGNEKLQFSDLEKKIGAHQLSYSNSAAYADFDNDGDYDLICNNIDQEAFLYENQSKELKSVQIDLKGPKNNTFGIGTKIIAYYPEGAKYFQHFSTKGFQSSMVNQILIPEAGLDSVRVIWPDLSTQTSPYNGGNTIDFEYKSNPSVVFTDNPNKRIETIILKDITAASGINFTHKENPFIEFNREPLIPFSTSAEGPALAVADVNSDGLEDFYIGSSKRGRSGVYYQKKDGTFESSALQGMPTDTIYEEVDAVFADIDKDGDVDLLVATGGNEYRLASPYTQPLLYRNENGQLIRDENAFADLHVTASCIAINDIDGDGDLDIFMGGRATPWAYGEIPRSYLLENDGKGNFKDISEQWLKGLSHIGFVKDGEWADMNADGKTDLVLALEWDAVTVLYNSGSEFKKEAIGKEKGWWNDVTIADFDQDGDLDIMAGNLGLNARLKASEQQPLRMYYNDFDDNGTKEQILSYYLKDREIPFSNMMELQKQIPLLKKKYLYAKDFAKASMEELIGPEKLKNSAIFTANWMENSLYLNEGDQSYRLVSLPENTQFTTFNTALAIDLNGDGQMDVIPGGNYHYCNVQMGRYDADNGSALLNSGEGTFSYFNFTGATVKGQVSQIRKILIGKTEAILFAQNNGPLKILAIDKLDI